MHKKRGELEKEEKEEKEDKGKPVWREATNLILFLGFPFGSNDEPKEPLSITNEPNGVTCTYTLLPSTIQQTFTVSGGDDTEKSLNGSNLQLQFSRHCQILRPFSSWVYHHLGSGPPAPMLKLLRLFEELARNGRDVAAALESDALYTVREDYLRDQEKIRAHSTNAGNESRDKAD